MPRSVVLTAVVLLTAGAAADAAAPIVQQQRRSPSKGGSLKLPALCLGLAGAVAGSVPQCRQAVRKLLNRDGLPMDFEEPPEPSSDEATTGASVQPSASSAPPSAAADDEAKMERLRKLKEDLAKDAADAEKFALTPDKLSAIADLNPKLEAISELLAPVPVFTAAVGNGTSPLTVPTEDGRKLAYFFTEQADAMAFLRAVKQNAQMDLDAQVIGASLSDIIKAYSTAEAKAAGETFVLIPTMAEVATARQLMRSAGKDPAAAEQVDKLGPHSGLVPVFWSENLAVQSAGGQHRKVLFFRIGDLSHMWRNLTEARKGNEGDIGQPTIQVSDLQTMAGLLVEAQKTDDVMFLPSSNAIKAVQQQGAPVGARSRRPAAAAGADSQGQGSPGRSAGAGAGDAETEEDFPSSDGIEEEDASGFL